MEHSLDTGQHVAGVTGTRIQVDGQAEFTWRKNRKMGYLKRYDQLSESEPHENI